MHGSFIGLITNICLFGLILFYEHAFNLGLAGTILIGLFWIVMVWIVDEMSR